ncbi:acetylornithine aminotransferase apoenzyme [Cupriavidus sp. YR651]|uniref:aspartate aminotransferase family protein n=1 Tax=Cupriavidus sp. YR651 TaxID=1855315 RepID=UPI00088B8A96|nr:aspartate aminotransferase family protein [Cupriavidus sp. YR651]SDD96271.1 acetylornithine aminotransferase apoenzyme [Cupriavidus sp. YR651]
MSSRLFPTYNRSSLAFARGEGSWLYTEDGHAYLDFASGVAVNALGHNNDRLKKALLTQAEKLWHVSNLYTIPVQERLAEMLCEASFADSVFFTNSGAEAIELAIKAARRFQYKNGSPNRYRIVTFEGAFHGRTLGALAATGRAEYLEGFGPKAPGFDHVPLGDREALERVISEETAGILVEPVQGESGIRSLPPGELRYLRELCDENGILLMLDEVQTGIGRTGTFFAYEAEGVLPDLLATAKGLGAGFPVGACLATEQVGSAMTSGSHGSTFGGNPLAMAVASEVLSIILSPGFLERVQQTSAVLIGQLREIVANHPKLFNEVRGSGLLLGLKCNIPVSEVIRQFTAEKLLCVPAADNVVRLLPPLTVSEAEVAGAVSCIGAASAALEKSLLAGNVRSEDSAH